MSPPATNPVRIDPEFRAIIPPLSAEELQQLEANLILDGCRDPLVVWAVEGSGAPVRTLLDGHNRHEICTRLGIQMRYCTAVGVDDRLTARIWIRNNQAGRRNLGVVDRSRLASGQEADFAELAKRNQSAAGGDKRSPEAKAKATRSLPQNSAEAIRGERESRTQAANLFGVSHDTVTKVRLMDATGTPALLAAARSGEISVHTAATLATLPAEQQVRAVRDGQVAALRAAKEVREQKSRAKVERKHALAAEIRGEPPPAPTGPYRVIVADPPWRYDKRAEDPTHRGANPYPDMTTAEICAIRVEEFAHQDCILWLWTTNAFMRDAFAVLDAWGFSEKTILTWAKQKMGVGDWLRGQTEHCILATRGHPVATLTNETTLLTADTREHSRKPDDFYALVERLCPGSKVEMFSRETRPGWAVWGAETGKFNAAI